MGCSGELVPRSQVCLSWVAEYRPCWVNVFSATDASQPLLIRIQLLYILNPFNQRMLMYCMSQHIPRCPVQRIV